MKSSRLFTTDEGLAIDMLKLAPRSIMKLGQEASLRWSDRAAVGKQFIGTAGAWVAPTFWEGIGPF
eukprot:16429543-Heterocapsa_arctica.AAC.1